jgi:ABC-2 type transport system ATP-binding protein
MVGLQADAKKKIGGYSRGMKQRLGIAQALINNPEILFLDEPVSALDPVGRKEVMEIIAGLSGSITVFFSTHVLSDVERVCDRVIIINKGKKLLEDRIENIKALNPAAEAELELDKDMDDQFTGMLRAEAFVETLEIINPRKIKIRVKNMEKAMRRIPLIISDNKFGIKRFVVLEPTLEEIFVKVVNGK